MDVIGVFNSWDALLKNSSLISLCWFNCFKYSLTLLLMVWVVLPIMLISGYSQGSKWNSSPFPFSFSISLAISRSGLVTEDTKCSVVRQEAIMAAAKLSQAAGKSIGKNSFSPE